MAILDKTKRLLLARSGGYCQNPNCNTDLFPKFEDGTITNIEELAHIIAQKENGPRGNVKDVVEDRDGYNNIILLCPTCHTTIDKNPSKYNISLLQKWKKDHEINIQSNFVVPKFETRNELQKSIVKLLNQNRVIFEEYGPQSTLAKNTPQSDASQMWNAKVINTIIPNNRTICEIINNNFTLLAHHEEDIFNKFILHKEGLEYNKLSGDKNSSVPLFPIEMNNILN